MANKCGIDPSFLGHTCSVFNKNRLIDFIFVSTDPSLPILSRILEIEDKTKMFLVKHKVKKCGIEIPFFNRMNPKTYFSQARLYQQLIYLMVSLEIEFHEVEPTLVKKIFTNSGNSDKDKMYESFSELYPRIFKSFDFDSLDKKRREGLIDSIAVGICIP